MKHSHVMYWYHPKGTIPAREDRGYGRRFWKCVTFMMSTIFGLLIYGYWLKCYNLLSEKCKVIKIMIFRNVMPYTVIGTNVLEEPVASMFKVKIHHLYSSLNMEQQVLSRCWYLSTKITRHHITEDLIFPKWSSCLQAIGTLGRINYHISL